MSLVLSLVKPRLTELGKIKVGQKNPQVRISQSGSEWRAPMKIDHFLLTTMHRNDKGDLIQDSDLMESLADKYADTDGKLRHLPVMVLSNEIDDIMQSAYVWYAGRKVAARSDGKTVIWYGDPKTMKFLAEPREMEWNPAYLEHRDPKNNRLFKLHTVFNCVIAAKEAKWGGVYKFRTTSQISASQLAGSLLHIQQLTGGVLRGLPLQLVVRPMQVSPDGKTTNVYVVHVELVGPDLLAIQGQALQLAKIEMENAKQLRSVQIEYRKLLVAPGAEESVTEAAEVAMEFHPETFDDDDQRVDGEDGTMSVKDLVRKNGPEKAPPKKKTTQPETAKQEPPTDREAMTRYEPITTTTSTPSELPQPKQPITLDAVPVESSDQPSELLPADPVEKVTSTTSVPMEVEDEGAMGDDTLTIPQSAKQSAKAETALAPASAPQNRGLKGTNCPEWKTLIAPFYNKYGGKEVERVSGELNFGMPYQLEAEALVKLAGRLEEMETAGKLKPKPTGLFSQ